jgi:transposase-like protein
MAVKDPDDSIVAIFKELAVKDEVASLAAGRPVFVDEEIVELHYPGSKNWSAHPATSFSNWITDPTTGEQVKVTYAERFRRQYQQFKAHATQTKVGTPLQHVPFLTEARRAELRAQNIYTVEALAHIDGQELKNLGQGGRDMKNAAMEYIATTQTGAISAQVQAELEALRAKNQVMEEDLAALKAAKVPGPNDEFDEMDLAQLREYITSNTGQAPLGTLNRKNLLRLARDAAPEKASAA